MHHLSRLISHGALLILIVSCGSTGGFPPEPDSGVTTSVCSSQSPNMTFFFTRAGANSGNLGGLAGADKICADAAAASGSTRGNWRAYLSALNDPTFGRVDARDRIGPGPWFNYCGDEVGNLGSIHGSRGIEAALMKAEDGYEIAAEDPNATLFDKAHDIFSGSDESGRLLGGNGVDDPPQTCADWTSDSPDDTAFVGHEDTDFSDGTWNSAHPTTGCDEDSLANTLAIGRIYCFSGDVVTVPDAGVEDNDAGTPRDAGMPGDGGMVPDAGDDRDAGMPMDGGEPACTPAGTMSFFMTEMGTGAMGGNLGGLVGADQICQTAAGAAGAGTRTWRAYLSALADPTFGRIDARDRIGVGPWFNYDGTNVGSLAEIHHEGGGNGIAPTLMKSACGFEVDAENPNANLFNKAHDIFTGSDEFGRLQGGSGGGDPPLTCDDWTSSSPSDIAFVGHEDTDFSSGFWNNAHPTSGCDQTSLAGTLAIGRLYCFAID